MSYRDILEGLYSSRLNEGKDECVVPICFGYEIWKIGNKFEVLNGEGDTVYTADSTFDAKKWCKDHKTSTKWGADSKWDWNRESSNSVAEAISLESEFEVLREDDKSCEIVDRVTGIQYFMKKAKIWNLWVTLPKDIAEIHGYKMRTDALASLEDCEKYIKKNCRKKGCIDFKPHGQEQYDRGIKYIEDNKLTKYFNVFDKKFKTEKPTGLTDVIPNYVIPNFFGPGQKSYYTKGVKMFTEDVLKSGVSEIESPVNCSVDTGYVGAADVIFSVYPKELVLGDEENLVKMGFHKTKYGGYSKTYSIPKRKSVNA